jgi:hypothetical protein
MSQAALELPLADYFSRDDLGVLDFGKSIPFWNSSDRRLWSLWDMIRYSCSNICEMYRGLVVAIEGLLRADDPQAELHDSFKEKVGKFRFASSMASNARSSVRPKAAFPYTSVERSIDTWGAFHCGRFGKGLRAIAG